MGTRHLIAAKIDGAYRIAQYGQWDGYPDGQGRTVLEFLQTYDRPTFEAKLRATTYMTEEEHDKFVIEANALGGAQCNLTQPLWPNIYPHLSRSTGAKILKLVATSPPLKLKDEIKFAQESLFCEWGYVVDLDTNTFEVFRGFNHDPLPEDARFYSSPDPPNTGHDGTPYHPIALVKSYSLDALPTIKQMINDCDPSEP